VNVKTALVNWVLLITLPLWIVVAFLVFVIREREFKDLFVTGKKGILSDG